MDTFLPFDVSFIFRDRKVRARGVWSYEGEFCPQQVWLDGTKYVPWNAVASGAAPASVILYEHDLRKAIQDQFASLIRGNDGG